MRNTHFLKGKGPPQVILAVREMAQRRENRDGKLLMWVEETPTQGLWGWVVRLFGMHRKTFRIDWEG